MHTDLPSSEATASTAAQAETLKITPFPTLLFRLQRSCLYPPTRHPPSLPQPLPTRRRPSPSQSQADDLLIAHAILGNLTVAAKPAVSSRYMCFVVADWLLNAGSGMALHVR
ncbi:unnamed protein product [Peniophora sp. CBMAI 1063]|nr:unnamed protein product [Peniophora sp. CBMAI 1063]